jgi:formamidopyrimidine-DNA glycosylase
VWIVARDVGIEPTRPFDHRLSRPAPYQAWGIPHKIFCAKPVSANPLCYYSIKPFWNKKHGDTKVKLPRFYFCINIKCASPQFYLVTALSVELPEAHILAAQLNCELIGKQVAAVTLQNCVNYQNLGFINMYLSDFQRLCNGRAESAVSRGNTIRVKLDNGLNLLLAPEYGGVILFHKKDSAVPAKFHFKVDFADGSALTVTLTGMGIIKALTDEELKESYLYQRDFSASASPLEADFTFERFTNDLAGKKVNLKAALVSRDAVVVGLGNSAFQDILYRAGIHPKRKASELNEAERRRLYDAIRFVVEQRIRLGGKTQFVDLYGRRGGYEPAMGSNMKGKICKACGADVEKLSLGGGQTYLCPGCQK